MYKSLFVGHSEKSTRTYVALDSDYCAMIVFHVALGRWVESILEALGAHKQSSKLFVCSSLEFSFPAPVVAFFVSR